MTGRLTGRVVAVTRDGDPDDPLPAALAAAGASVRSWPTLAFAGPADPTPLDAAVRRLGSFDWVVFTSARAVDPVVRRAMWPESGPRIAAPGGGTAARIGAAGWPVDVVGGGDGAAGLVRALQREEEMVGRRVLFPAGNLAGTALEEGLGALGAEVERVEAYQTLVCPPDPATVRRDLARGVHVVVFCSPSAVEGLTLALEGDLAGGLDGCAVVAAGRTTASALARAGIDWVTIAGSPDPEGLVNACGQAV
ncbi:MAG: uroporphyrinogen-III synthase [Longimicrobiales bacterium]